MINKKKTIKNHTKCLYCGEKTFEGVIMADCNVIIDSTGKLIASIQRDQLDNVYCSNCLKHLNRDLYKLGWDYAD